MSRNPYKTIADLNGIILNDVPEGVTLEYKGSSVFTNKDAANVLCKVVTSFANSIGGQFVIGIESQNGIPIRLDGGVLGNSKMDWIHTIINGQTFPAVESVDVLELKDATGSYYVIHVPPSAQAPHQSNDKRYYKRRGTHSEPMEHYEIEDVRNRPKRGPAPVRIQLLMQDHLAYLSIKNDHSTDSVRNLKCRLEPNFKMDHKSAETLNTRGLRELRAQAEQNYWLDTIFTMLARNPEAELKVDLNYEFHETIVNETMIFYVADLNNSAIVQTPNVIAINRLGEKIEKIAGQLEKIKCDTASLLHIVDGTGLRLSQRTLRGMRDLEQMFDPHEFDWNGYKIILDITGDEAIALHHAVKYGDREDYNALDAGLRAKFEKHFKLEFD